MSTACLVERSGWGLLDLAAEGPRLSPLLREGLAWKHLSSAGPSPPAIHRLASLSISSVILTQILMMQSRVDGTLRVAWAEL